jgi:hypothetical protein
MHALVILNAAEINTLKRDGRFQFIRFFRFILMHNTLSIIEFTLVKNKSRYFKVKKNCQTIKLPFKITYSYNELNL